MISSQMKKSLYLAVGLVFVLIFGQLGYAGQFSKESRPAREESQKADAGPLALPTSPGEVTRKITAFFPGKAHAAEYSPPAFVRKKLPTMTPEATPTVEPLPAAAAPVSEAPKPVAEQPQETAPPEPAPAASTAMPELGPAPSSLPAPPTKTEPPKPEPKALAGARGAYPFSILLSSCREKPNAVAALSDYRKAGLTPYIAETDLGGRGLWWRILAGYYRTLEEASQARKALKVADTVVVKTPYANLIGQYGSEKEALLAAAEVTTQEVFPYVVRGPGNSFQLLTGAFPSQQAAEKHQRELESKGIATRTIQR